MKQLVIRTLKENLYFIIPCISWYVVGGFLLYNKTRNELFFAINSIPHTSFNNKLNDVFSAYGRGDVIAILLLLLLLIPEFRNKLYIFSAGIFGLFIPTIIFFSKYFFDQPRPISFYGFRQVQTVPWLDNYLNNSFPSGHTLGAFGFFCLWSIFMPKKLKPISLVFFTIALLVGFSRLYLGQHFFQDIYAGSIAGVFFTIFIYVTTAYFLQSKTNNNVNQ